MPTTTITPVSETIFEVKIYTVDPDLAVLAAEAAVSAADAAASAIESGNAASDAEEAANIATGAKDEAVAAAGVSVTNANAAIDAKEATEILAGQAAQSALDAEQTLDTQIDKYGTLEQPADFDFPYKLEVVRRVGETAKLINLTIDTFRKQINAPVIKYVDQISGLDSNDGNSWATAYKTLGKLSGLTYDRAYFKKGNYASVGNVVFNKDVEFISVGGLSNFCFGVIGTDRTWTDQTGGVWSNVLTATPKVICESTSFDLQGDLLRYTQVLTLSECQALVGSFYKNTGTNTLYIHTRNNLTPNRADLILALDSMLITNGFQTYVEGVNFIHGVRLANSTSNQNIIVHKNCYYGFATDRNSCDIKGNSFTFFEGNRAYKSKFDGFGYGIDGVYSPKGIELNGIGNYNGEGSSTGVNNGTTTHHNCRILRIGGIYHDNEGTNVHDVNTAKSWNIDCVAYNSVSTVPENKTDFGSGALGSDTAKVWLDGCITKKDGSYGAKQRSPSSLIYDRNSLIFNIDPDTTLIPY